MWRLLLPMSLCAMSSLSPVAAAEDDEVSFVFRIPFGASSDEVRDREVARAVLMIRERDPYEEIACEIICKRAERPEDPIEIDFEALASGIRSLSAPIPFTVYGDGYHSENPYEARSVVYRTPVVGSLIQAIAERFSSEPAFPIEDETPVE